MTSCSKRFAGLTIIPVVFFVNLANFLNSGPMANLIVQKLCSPEGPPQDINKFICHKPDIVSEASGIMSTRTTIRSVMTAFGSLIFGMWRDSSGHSKYLMLIGEAGEFITAILYLLLSWSWSMSPWIPVIIESLIGGFSGFMIYQMGADCNVISNSKPEERTMRLQYFFAATLLAMLVGSSCGGFILAAVGFVWSYVIAICVHTTAVILIIVLVHDKKNETTQKWNLLKKLKDVFTPKPNGTVLWIMLICSTFMVSVYTAEAVQQVYYQQEAFQFSVKDASVYGTYHFMIPVLGSIIMPTLFIKGFKWSDFTVGIVAAALATIASLANAFVKSKLALYLIAPLNLMKYVLNTVPQSIFSKCIKDHELGLYFGVVNVGSIILPFAVNYLYHYVFTQTSQNMPGAIFFISAASTFICLMSFWICSCLFVEPEKTDKEDSAECGEGVISTGNQSNSINRESQ